MIRSLTSLALLTAILSACGGATQRPRNLLIVCIDTLRADELGAYGRTPSITPALDRLANAGVVFERAHAAASWTLPSIGAIFTSYSPSTTNLWTFEDRLSQSFDTLAERFQSAGYRTHGVASHIYFDDKYGLQQGFDSFDDELCRKGHTDGWVPLTSPQVSKRAARWLDERSDDTRPWLLFVHYFDPHVPYLDHQAARLDDRTRPERARYRSEIAFTDQHVGALLDALEHSGHADDTNVLFFSDHGESFLEHPPIRRHSYGLYEEELRVPLILRVPGTAPRRVPSFVRGVDLLPTLLELHGLPADDLASLEGRSLVPLLDGGTLDPAPVLAQIRLKDGFHANALISGKHKLYEDVSGGRMRLFDLDGDANESHDLAASEPELLAELERTLRASIRASVEKASRFPADGEVQLSDEELEHLRELGYSGDDPGED